MEEAPEGGWVGYGQAEVKLAPGGAVKTLESEQKPLRRWGRHKMAGRSYTTVGYVAESQANYVAAAWQGLTTHFERFLGSMDP